MKPKAYHLEQLQCSSFAAHGQSFEMCSLTHLMAEDGVLEQVYRPDYYMLVLVIEGSGNQLIDFQEYEMLKGRMFLMHPGQVHAWKRQEQLKGYVLFFTNAFFGLRYHNNSLLDFPFFNASYKLPYLDLPDGILSKLVTLFELMYEEFQSHSDQTQKVLRSYLNIVLVECQRYYDTQEKELEANDNHTRQLVRQFLQLIEEHYVERHSVKAYAELLALTPNYLNAIAQKVMGHSAGVLIRERIMLEARRMLLHDDKTVAEIGSDLNFDDSSYFCRFFKKYEGTSPEQFRKQFTVDN